MKLSKVLCVFVVSVSTSLSSVSFAAGIPVVDAAAIGQMVSQITELKRHYEQMLRDYEQLQQYPQILRGDAQLAERTEFAAPVQESAGRIHVQDRASMYELLRGVPGSYAWSNPLPEAECRRQGLVQRRCAGVQRVDIS